jgi:N-glycosylase/DNA lyase
MSDFKLTTTATLSIRNTLECGQCFRWRRNGNAYRGIVCGVPAIVYENGEFVCVKTTGTKKFWIDYFDVERDYDSILASFPKDKFTQEAVKYGNGLRMLKQDAWEMLVSYIISQNSNIPKIASSIEKICTAVGDKVEFAGEIFYAFPSPEQLTKLSLEKLRTFSLGYRAEYVSAAAKLVCEHKFDLANLIKLSTQEAIDYLLTFNKQLPLGGKMGIGAKVANCLLLFGLNKLDAFPVDTWMKKANKYYNNNLSPTDFGEYAGIAQEYIFHYVRHIERD